MDNSASQSSVLSNNQKDINLDPQMRFLWSLREECYSRLNYTISSDTQRNNITELRCPLKFDGYLCWNATQAGERAIQPCPKFVIGFDPERYAFKDCLENGTWYRDPVTNSTWTNYTDCVDHEDFKFRKVVNNFYIGGYTISVFALLVSLTIFFAFRTLRCTRIAIHIHLFTSLLLNNSMWLIWYIFIITDPNIMLKNGFFCQAIHVIIQYLMLTNYMWMFCEALHLHLLLEVVFVRDDYAMKWFHFIGWIFPMIITALYTIVRLSNVNDTTHCWVYESDARWFLVIPVMISILISLLFLVNVMRIMLTKSHSNVANSSTIPMSIRRAVRAALILTPLFGLHHILLPFRPTEKSFAEVIYDVFSALLISLQGLWVSILFCFASVDVHMALKLSYKKLQRTGTHVTHVTATTHQPSIGRDTV